jgi:hypothetical protein
MKNDSNDRRATIVCKHIANGRLPILRAVRTEPLEPEDSGWQFLCNSGSEEREAEAEVWLVKEVIEYESSLAAFINLPVGTTLSRSNAASQWMSTI